MGFLFIVGLTMVLLKAAGVLTVSWAVATAAWWIIPLLWIFMVVLTFVFALFAMCLNYPNSNRRFRR